MLRLDRLLQPVWFELLDPARELDRLSNGPTVVTIDQKVYVRPYRLPHRFDPGHVLLERRAGHLHLDGVESHIDVLGHLLLQIGDRLALSVEAAGAIDSHDWLRSAQQAPDRLVEYLADKVPDRDIDLRRIENPVG